MGILGKSFLFVVIGLASLAASANKNVRGPATRFTVMSFNVENLFDTINSPNTSDTEFTPTGSNKWTETVLRDKLVNLGKIIRSADADVVGLSEVENIETARRLLTDGGLSRDGFQYVVLGGTRDPRGIQNGLLSRFPIVHSTSHPVLDESNKQKADVDPETILRTRDILEATVNTGAPGTAGLVTFFVVHWPSRRTGEASVRKRMVAAKVLQAAVDSVVARYPERRVVVLGDFNDELHDESIQEGLRTVTTAAQLGRVAAGSLYPTDYDIAHLPKEERGTYYYDKEKVWNEFDHILMAGGSRLNRGGARGYRYVPGSFEVFRHNFVTNGKFPVGCELKDRKSNEDDSRRCLRGAADHLPTLATFAL